MATVYKRESTGTWYAKYFDPNGKRVSRNTGCTSKRDALREATRMEAEALDVRMKAAQLPKAYAAVLESAAREAALGSLTLARSEELVAKLHRIANPGFKDVSLRQFWLDWIVEQRRHVAPSTALGYKHDFDVFAGALGEKVMKSPPRSLTVDQVNRAMDKARSKGLGKGKETRRASTVNKALSSLRRVMEAAIAQDLASHNPAKLSRALRQNDSTDKAPFTIAEVRAMVEHPATTAEWRGAITLAAHTGLRLRDVLSLSRKNVDGTRLVVMPRKTARTKKTVTVPLSPPCLSWIGERRGPFFPTLRTLAASGASMQFSAIMAKAGVPKEIELPGGMKGSRSFHSLRHSFTSWLAEADIHADVRQKLTGHASAGIHAKYTHHDEALDRAVLALPAI